MKKPAMVLVAAACLGTLPASATRLDLLPRTAQVTLLPGIPPTHSPGLAAACVPNPRTTSESNAPDAISGPQTQVIYFIPAGGCDERLDEGVLQNSMNSLNAFYVAQGLGPLIIDRDSSGAMDIPFVIGQSTSYSFSALNNELSSRGFTTAGGKRYIIYAALNKGGICGTAQYPGNYAQFYLDSASGCGTRDFGNGTLAGAGAAEVVTGQEIIHNEGVVSQLAPQNCWPNHTAHVCFSALTVESGQGDPWWPDIMFPYALPGVRLSQKNMDLLHANYFKTPPGIHSLVRDLADSPYWSHP